MVPGCAGTIGRMTSPVPFFAQCQLQATADAATGMAAPPADTAQLAHLLGHCATLLRPTAATAGPTAAVLLCGVPTPYTAVVELAIWRAGLVVVQTEAGISPQGLAHALHQVQAQRPVASLVCHAGVFGWASKAAFLAGVPAVYTVADDGEGTLLDRARHHPTAHTPAQVDVAALAWQGCDALGTPVPQLALRHGDVAALAAHCRQRWAAQDLWRLPAA